MDSLGWIAIAFGVAAAYLFQRYNLYDAAALRWKSPSGPDEYYAYAAFFFFLTIAGVALFFYASG
ncbi:hypothetical protein [Mesorhizobium kowhaii]|jgi:hypothetical protein|uniref:Uncharacterized protein n=1 Tax=Mesorhizobium kowhaii TaxID=1300272 RepID=A0A2W7CSQ9_9HYPH|nr:hypothetical protein [Mesorhizobium kowhaii]PZV36779.1 hypothetical protein B5V02_18865 [Mesorhizobium kowhaii]